MGLSRGATPTDDGEHRPPGQPSFGSWLGSIWLYTGLRFALFLALWGILVLLGLSALIAALVALVLSVPLSFVLLARPRQRVADALEQRLAAQRARRERLADTLEQSGDFAPPGDAAGRAERPPAGQTGDSAPPGDAAGRVERPPAGQTGDSAPPGDR